MKLTINKKAFLALVMISSILGSLVLESCASGGKSGYSARQKSHSRNDRIKRNTNFMTY